MAISMRLEEIFVDRERSDMARQDVDTEGEEAYSVEIHYLKDRDEDIHPVCCSTSMYLRRHCTSNFEGLRT